MYEVKNMNRKIGIIDIGSNTIVLVVYDVLAEAIQQIHYTSTAVHLVQYIQNHHMSQDGIKAAAKVFNTYVEYCKTHNIEEIHADITECGRSIDNCHELITAAHQSGIQNIQLLTGEEEAMCDFFGASLDSTLEDGLLIDIGGGSTELVRFTNSHKVLDACSIPLGCVRLQQMAHPDTAAKDAIQKAMEQHPSLTPCTQAIGVGGTIRACRMACDLLHHSDHTFTSEDLYDLYESLLNNRQEYWEAVHKTVTVDRIPVLLPGLSMFAEVSKAFGITHFHNSEYGVREGFLLHFVLKRV